MRLDFSLVKVIAKELRDSERSSSDCIVTIED
jgi:hypothetical protein